MQVANIEEGRAVDALGNRHWLQVALVSIADAVIATDTDGKITFLNPAAANLTGWGAEDALGQPAARVFRLLHEPTRQQVPDPVRRVLAEGKATTLELPVVLVMRDGSERPIEDSIAPLRDDQGRVLGVVMVFRDISERRRAERERQKIVEALREADRRKDEFLAMLAHELRNPLAPIRNALQILRTSGAAGAVADRALDIMERQLGNLVRLVDDLLDVSRIVRGKVQLRRERVALAQVVARAVETTQPIIDAGRHELTIHLPDEPVWLDADPLRLAQVLANLLNNAARYTERPGRIWLSGAVEQGEVVLRIRDTGAGISEALLPDVFDLFVQADRALSRSQGGLGIGLTVVKNLVQMHGGTVEAHSAGPGQGSEFIVRLPLGQASSAACAW